MYLLEFVLVDVNRMATYANFQKLSKMTLFTLLLHVSGPIMTDSPVHVILNNKCLSISADIINPSYFSSFCHIETLLTIQSIPDR